MNKNSLSEALAALHFTASLSARTLDQLAGLAEYRDYDTGATVFREGNPGAHVFIVAAGHVTLDMQVTGRGPVRILTLGPGDLLAWSGIVGGGRLTATATAIESTRLVALPAQGLADLSDQDHEFGFQWMRALAMALAKRLVATRLQLLDLFADHRSAGDSAVP